MRILAVLLFTLTLSVTAPARAADRVPDSAVQLRIVSRDSVSFVVEVTNPLDDVARFDGIGLYFVPDTASDEQRLGVVAAGQIAKAGGGWVDAADVTSIDPHKSIRLKLTTYCLDEQRAAPEQSTSFHLASRRMPTALTIALAGAARTVASLPKTNDRYDATQQAVWRVRTSMPVALIGDAAPRVSKRIDNDD